MRVGLIGNPNVGKSTIFNTLTGLRQHTGNWPGKTVDKKTGFKKYKNNLFEFEDLPGTYSLSAHSSEEEVTRDFVFFEKYDALIIVCDAVCLERNLNLVMQVLEVTNKVIIGINLVDEAKKKGIEIDYAKLSNILNVPVIPLVAINGEGINELLDSLNNIPKKTYKISYNKYIDFSLKKLYPFTNNDGLSLKLLSNELSLISNFKNKEKIIKELKEVWEYLYKKGLDLRDINTLIIEEVNDVCKKIINEVVTFKNKNYLKKDKLIDKILTGKITGKILMLLMLFIILWITIKGANYISDFLYDFLFSFENKIIYLLKFIHLPKVIIDMIVYGILRTLFWVVSVMLPPMAIFFPLFTLLEDLGYLPRIAFNLDHVFQKCDSCGKQSLTMAMGFGCNAVGVMGARIIDSPRERIISILTNSFIPCNGRFPILISLVTMFLSINNNSFSAALIITFIILLSIFVSLVVSKILSKTILKGVPSSFILELPPYRKPQIRKILIRSIFDRTLFVLKRAVYVSIPAGLFIWILANTYINDLSILKHLINFFNSFAFLFGLDGVILISFILGFPANEIVIPIMIMGYMSLGKLTNFSSLESLKTLFINNGWTKITAICTIIFTLMHWPCLTTVLTIKKETVSFKWTLFSILIPMIVGLILCFMIAQFYCFIKI